MGQFSPHFLVVETYTLHRAMEYNYSTLWISLLNTVFASIAFFVWYFLSIEEKAYKQPKIKEQEIKIVEIEEEPQEDNAEEERHLYIKDGKVVNYPELYMRRNDAEEEYKEIRPKPAVTEKKVQRETHVASEVSSSSKPFQWPRQDDIIRTGPALDDDSRVS